ncbi:MAG: (d)CMP kinase [Acidimicrobiales bacterium]|jgi:cytidylate kinase|nr:cytidylate kinase [Acidimicrobiaceae bacterium]MDP6162754.1 (d)CMP kinase [Acidimicrobiales bacterium]MDP6285981.1 (d)CMP kinase [Acidimicrobiales bacterium]HJO40963.1 (d)CMP kinase [Acidimicrobiales bacterium]
MSDSTNEKIIAIDGPAGSGKSTIAKALAKRLNLEYLDTGAMYRAVALISIQQKIETTDEKQVLAIAKEMDFNFEDGICVVNGFDATKEIRGSEVTRVVSVVAAMPTVRQEMVERQRLWVEKRSGGVVEGRDIGSVVFPKAKVKVYLTASEEVRAERRIEQEETLDASKVADSIRKRDEADIGRSTSPLVRSEGSIEIDTSLMGVEETIEEILGFFKWN